MADGQLQRYRVSRAVWTCAGLSLAQDAVFNEELFTKGDLFKQTKRDSLLSEAGVQGIIKVAVARGHIKPTNDALTVRKEIKAEEVAPVPAAKQAEEVSKSKGKGSGKSDLTAGAK
jgi:hypothetical protein